MLLHALEPFARPFVRLYARTRRGMTLGVRGLVTNEAGEVLLIKHTYLAGWYLPGGGVERGETAEPGPGAGIGGGGGGAADRPRRPWCPCIPTTSNIPVITC